MKINYQSNQLIDLRRLTRWNACEVKSQADTRLQVHSSGDLGRVSTCEIGPAEKGRKNSSKLVFDDQIWYSPEYIKKKTAVNTLPLSKNSVI